MASNQSRSMWALDYSKGAKLSTKSGHRLKILAIFHVYLSEDQKKGLRSITFLKSGVSPQKLQKYGY